MKELFIAVDAGKHATKSVLYNTEIKKIKKNSYRTKISIGDMRDDAIEKDTHIFEMDGNVYKIGNGARGDGANLETSKLSDMHRLSILYSIASFCDDKENIVNVAIGLPAKEWAVVQKREDYKTFVFDKDEYEMTIKTDSSSKPVKKRFKINHKYVFPESIGALCQDDSPAVNKHSYFGVLDIGNLNLNATVWQGNELQQDVSLTDELGAVSLIQGLSQELSAEFSRCDEGYVARLLALEPNNRYLKPNNGNKEIELKSKELISKYLLEHAKKIKRACDGKKWSLDYMTLVAIGGTSLILHDEIKQVFGESITVLQNPTFSNALGYLRMMCVKEPSINEVIPLIAE